MFWTTPQLPSTNWIQQSLALSDTVNCRVLRWQYWLQSAADKLECRGSLLCSLRQTIRTAYIQCIFVSPGSFPFGNAVYYLVQWHIVLSQHFLQFPHVVLIRKAADIFQAPIQLDIIDNVSRGMNIVNCEVCSILALPIHICWIVKINQNVLTVTVR